MTNCQGKRQSGDANLELVQMLELSDKIFKHLLLTVLHEVKAYTLEMNGKIGVPCREIKIMKKSQMGILELKNIIA